MLFRTWIMTQLGRQGKMAQMVESLLGERCHYAIRYATATHSRLLALTLPAFLVESIHFSVFHFLRL